MTLVDYQFESGIGDGFPGILITLSITPVIYLYFEQFREKVLDRTSFFRSDRAPRRHPGVARGPALCSTLSDWVPVSAGMTDEGDHVLGSSVRQLSALG